MLNNALHPRFSHACLPCPCMPPLALHAHPAPACSLRPCMPTLPCPPCPAYPPFHCVLPSNLQDGHQSFSVDLDESFTLDCTHLAPVADLNLHNGRLHIDRDKVSTGCCAHRK